MTDTLNDLQTPDLTERLARYIGAIKLSELGLASEEFIAAKLDQLWLGCRAADVLLKVNTHHPDEMAKVADRMHQRLTS